MNSIWQQTSPLPSFEPQKADFDTEVLIIGGGITGILCAYLLKQQGIRSVLIEADRLCSGTTGCTTAKITAQHNQIYHKIAKTYGLQAAKQYLFANRQAVEQYRSLCAQTDCDFCEQSAFLYSRTSRRELENELQILQKLGAPVQFSSCPNLPFGVAGAIEWKHQAQFHPLKLLASLLPELCIYEQTKALRIENGQVITNRGTIRAEKVIVATHFPIFNLHGGYFAKLYQHRSYVMALKGVPPFDGMYLDIDPNGVSMRFHNDLLLLGGGSHRTGKSGGNWDALSAFARKYFPDSSEVCRWAAQDCMTLDAIPYIGQYSLHTPNLFVATGFQKWGMTSAMVAAELLRDLVLGKENELYRLYSPSRSIFHPQLAVNLGETLLNFIRPTVPRCPHMGCALRYNPAEHSWDCPCHGSRFGSEGELKDNPATDDLSSRP